jgi:hypothetical protein
MNNQTYKIHWRIGSDFPERDGWYLGISRSAVDMEFWSEDLEFYEFRDGSWTVMDPDFWTEVPLPKD